MSSPKFDIITVLAIFGMTGVLSNVAVLAVLFKKENRKLATSRYLINLAISDILMSCFVLVRIIEGLHIDIWSETDCRVFAIVRYLPLYLGINSIMLIAVERFVAIVLPTHFRAFVAPGKVKLQLTFVWLLTFVELIFPWYYVEVVAFGGLHFCTIYYKADNFYYMSLTAIILPAVLLLTLYGTIVGVVVHRQRKVNASITSDPVGGVLSTMKKEQAARCQRSAIRVAVTCAVVTILFLVCWLPVWIISFLLLFKVALVSTTIYNWTTVIVYLHSSMNPVVYFVADDRFRSVFLRLVCRKDTDVGVAVQKPSSVNETTT
ncbi:hypothetical protein LSAT2_012172 [Lamellibrachia satsuma]|nr:hypothetical protein LSAT2_012172 [Lamellibrachia satsuma]